MTKKIWTKPEVANIGIESTQGGGKKPTVHDGNIYELPNGIYVEEYKS